MTELADEQTAVVKAQAAFGEALEQADKAKAALDEAQEALDAALVAAEGPKHPHQDQIDRMAYIQSQAEQRAARADTTAQLRAIFPDGELPASRSALDTALKGSRKRGQARPARDVKD